MVKFVHVRQIDDKGNLLTNGGLTVAYTATLKDIMVSHAQCSYLDNFNYCVGRQIAAGRLRKYGAEEVLERKDPLSRAVLDWAAKEIFFTPIEIKWNEVHKRWESTFESLEANTFELEPRKGVPAAANEVIPDVEGPCKDCAIV